MTTDARAPLKKLTLKRETLRVLVRSGLRAGAVPGAQGEDSVRQGTLTETGQGVPPP